MFPRVSFFALFGRSFFTLLCALPFATSALAEGRLAGKITDAQGRAVVAAQITATEQVTGHAFKTTTNEQGEYLLADLPAGTYTIEVVAKGFAPARRADVTIKDAQTPRLDFQLSVAPVEAQVTVTSTGTLANSDPVYQKLRQAAKDPNPFSAVATVSNLVLQRDAARFTLRSGELYFLTPVEGRTVAAVFIGDGEISLTPPTEIERKSLAIFTDGPSLEERFSMLVLRFTDRTFDEVKGSPNVQMVPTGGQAGRARDLYRDNQELLRKRLKSNLELRTLADIYAPARPGFFIAFIGGKRFGKLVYIVDPLGIPEVSPEEVALLSYGDTDGGIWTAFHLAEEYKQGQAHNNQDRRWYDILSHKIDARIRGTRIEATDRIEFRPLIGELRVQPFQLFRSLRVRSVRDAEGRELAFVQEDKDEDADFAVIWPTPLETGKIYEVTVNYDGEGALRDSGSGNFILIPRDSWYPNNGGSQFGDRARFDVTYRYPKGYTLIGTGKLAGAEQQEEDWKVARWTSGEVELAVAGFNYGKFKKKEIFDKDSGYLVQFFANEQVPDEMRQLQLEIDRIESEGFNTMTTLGSISTAKMGDQILASAQNSLRIFNVYFGKLPYERFAMSQQPAINFGQAWPTLIYMPYTAFIDTTQRVQLFGIKGGTDTFWRYVGPHELAHQWWGHIIGWTSYHDQWMSEGFAEFSASLYVQYVRRDLDKFIDFWEEQRRMITDEWPQTKGRRPYTVGPVTQGYRLNSAKTGNVARFMIYPKGAYILHMIRMMMYDRRTGDARFQAMMRDFVKTYYNKDVSTEDFKRIVEKHMTPEMNLEENGKMDWFFNQWVYGTQIPSYRFDYSISSSGGKAILSGKLMQSGVSDGFRMLVPLYVDFGRGWTRLGTATLVGNSTLDIQRVELPQEPKRVAVAALKDVLAIKIENVKR